MGIIIIYFQLTVHGVNGSPGQPALEDVVAGIRPQPGLLLSKPRMEGVPVLGDQ